MEEDDDEFIPLPQMLQEEAPIAGTSKETLHDSDDEVVAASSSDEETSEERKPKVAKIYTTKIPPHLKGLMGEANLRFARGI